MSINNFSRKTIGAGILALSLAVMPATLPAAAQENQNRPTIDTTPFQETRNDNNNWGWLGLIGLIGLANLLRKPASRPTAYADPDPAINTEPRR